MMDVAPIYSRIPCKKSANIAFSIVGEMVQEIREDQPTQSPSRCLKDIRDYKKMCKKNGKLIWGACRKL
jgi:hypothetical protein